MLSLNLKSYAYVFNPTETTKPKASVDKPTDTVSDGFMDGFDFE